MPRIASPRPTPNSRSLSISPDDDWSCVSALAPSRHSYNPAAADDDDDEEDDDEEEAEEGEAIDV